MDIVFYVIIFIIGTLLGSLYASIIQGIIKGKKVISIHSYCENCGKKINLFEKIPIISYIFLKGKCKQCNKKIDKKYIILEILIGVIGVLVANGLDICVTNITITNFISYIFINIYIAYMILTIVLDNQKKNIPATLLAYGNFIAVIYIVYLCITESISIYRNVLYLVIMTILLLINAVNIKRRAQDSYVINLLTTILIMLIFTEKMVSILTLVATLISIALYIFIKKIKRSKIQKNIINSKINILFILGTLNLIIFLTLINII